VQNLINRGVGSDPTNQNSTMLRGILGIEEGCRCRLENVGVQEANPTQLMARAIQGFKRVGGAGPNMWGAGNHPTNQKPIRVDGARMTP